ncbi:hypothetical protein [Achromobacter sp. UMC46]|uniref:hypothetical protein n=1 Tax=Achromobacter sp. UMC46 TaxID=1862319 RepID=UPI00160058A9|nr:hypothetical protein [Achromobacter sp. UMC46]MBB1593061.1 hypothetical protein [Achromobacter sp. UMC46]
MTLCRAVLSTVLFCAVSAGFPSAADAACSDKKILSMSDEGKSVKAIAKACNMPAAKVRAAIESDEGNADASADASTPAPAARKLPSGSGLASCDCQGTVPYGEKAPELRCQSGISIATPCAGYCPPRGVAPWRRVCS